MDGVQEVNLVGPFVLRTPTIERVNYCEVAAHCALDCRCYPVPKLSSSATLRGTILAAASPVLVNSLTKPNLPPTVQLIDAYNAKTRLIPISASLIMGNSPVARTGLVPPQIIRDSSGLKIEGTRISINHIWELYRADFPVDEIALTYQISMPQVRKAIEYIEAHRDEVIANYAIVEKRMNTPPPAWVQERIKQNHEKLLALRDKLKQEAAQKRNGEQ